jgi:Sel1 repeat
MTVRCVQCGQENNPQYRFCGMCGAPLGPPPAPVATDPGRERVRVPVSGPSFLGLGDERSRDLDYLFEDEPARGHGRLYLALLLLLVSAGLLAWHWQRDGYPWAGYILRPTATTQPAPSAPPVQAPESAAAAAPVLPVEPTANPAPPEAQPVASQPSQSSGAEPAGTVPAVPAAKPAGQASQPAEVPDSGGVETKSPPIASPQMSEPEAAEPSPTQTPTPKETPAATVAPTPKSVSPKPSPATPADSFEDRLVADGEKYLYGRGVPQDCERAQRNLQIGARQSNSKAQTLLGAMYATGHCVSRDLPTAYRWFAKALHGDPGNSRVQQDLEVLWKQMTPEERQLAMKTQ